MVNRISIARTAQMDKILAAFINMYLSWQHLTAYYIKNSFPFG